MKRGIGCAAYGEDDFFDFVVKERIARLIASRFQGITCDLGEHFLEKDSALYSVPIMSLSRRLDDFNAYACDLYEMASQDFESDFHAGISLECLSYLSYAGIIDVDSVRNVGDGEVVHRIYQYTDALDKEEEPYLVDFYHQLKEYVGGNKTMLDEPVFKEVCEALADVFAPKGVKLPAEFAADNACLLLSSFETGNDESVRVIVYTSHEVAFYQRYRSLLPDDIRQKADAFLEVFECPCDVTDSHVRYRIYGDMAVCLVCQVLDQDIYKGDEGIYEDLACECLACTRGFNVWFEAAVRWLDENLVKLRMEYYGDIDMTDDCDKVVAA